MSILQRHKKSEEAGFKTFVKSLETTPEEKRKIIFKTGLSEDPLYMKAARENMLTLDVISMFSEDDLATLIQNTPNAPAIFAKAFFSNLEVEDRVYQKVNRAFQKQYDEEKDLIGPSIKEGEREAARFKIFMIVRKLQEEKKIALEWKFPEKAILVGKEHNLDHGKWQNNYDDGSIESEGPLVDFKKHGKWTFYHQNGNKLAEGGFHNGKKTGLWTFWYETGKKLASGSYVNDLRDGAWKEFNEDGVEQVDYKLGKIKSRKKIL